MFFRECSTFNPSRLKERATIVGSYGGFKSDIYRERIWLPHEEMRKALEAFNYNSLFQASVNRLQQFIIGDGIHIVSDDIATIKGLEEFIDTQDLDLKMEEIVQQCICTGNAFIEIEWDDRLTTEMGGLPIPIAFHPVPDSSRIYINCNMYGNPRIGNDGKPNLAEFYLQRVPETYWGSNSKYYTITYMPGARQQYLRIRAIPIHKDKLIHFRMNLSDNGIYGRSFLASALDDNATLYEIERSLAVLARYKAVPKKIIQYGDKDMQANEEETDAFIAYLDLLEKEENPVINKPVAVKDLSYAGRDINMDYMLRHVTSKIFSGLVPGFLVGIAPDVNRATAQHELVAFLLAVESMRKRYLRPLKRSVLLPVARARSYQKFVCQFGQLNFESPMELVQRVVAQWQGDIITLNQVLKLLGYPQLGSKGDVYHTQWQTKLMPPMMGMGGEIGAPMTPTETEPGGPAPVGDYNADMFSANPDKLPPQYPGAVESPTDQGKRA